jgi:hypothetical protein
MSSSMQHAEDTPLEFPAPAPLQDEVNRVMKRTYDVFYATQRLQLPEAPEL